MKAGPQMRGSRNLPHNLGPQVHCRNGGTTADGALTGVVGCGHRSARGHDRREDGYRDESSAHRSPMFRNIRSPLREKRVSGMHVDLRQADDRVTGQTDPYVSTFGVGSDDRRTRRLAGDMHGGGLGAGTGAGVRGDRDRVVG